MVIRLLIGALAAFLLTWAVLWWVQGKDGVSVTTEDDLAEAPLSTRELSGPAAQLSRYGLSGFVGLLGTVVGLFTGDREMSGACLVLLALNAFGLAVGYLLGALDGQVEAARKVLDFLGG